MVASSLPYNDILPVQFEDKTGVFIEENAFRDMLTGHERDLGEQRNAAAESKAREDWAVAQEKECRKIAEKQIWRATWGPVIGGSFGFVCGVGATAGGAGIAEALHR